MPLEVIKEICIRCTLKHTQNELGWTPLHIACKNVEYYTLYSKEKRKDLLELVSDAKSINVLDNEGNTPLHIACQMDDLESIIFLASKYNCDVNLLNGDQCLPVHYAVRSSKAMEMVKVVSTGCTLIHMQNRNWMTPLHIACKEKNVDVVKYLVFEKKCFPSFFKHSSDIYDNLDIRLACEAGADISLLNAIASKQNINIQHRDLYSNTQNTPISVACICHNISAIELFRLQSLI